MPDDIAAQAEATCEQIRALVEQGAEPFGTGVARGTSASWPKPARPETASASKLGNNRRSAPTRLAPHDRVDLLEFFLRWQVFG